MDSYRLGLTLEGYGKTDMADWKKSQIVDVADLSAVNMRISVPDETETGYD